MFKGNKEEEKNVLFALHFIISYWSSVEVTKKYGVKKILSLASEEKIREQQQKIYNQHIGKRLQKIISTTRNVGKFSCMIE